MSNEFDNGGWAMDEYNGNTGNANKREKPLGYPTEFSALYKAEIVVLVSATLAVLSALVQAELFMTVSFLVSSVASIVFLVFIMKLRHYSDDFKTAAICYLVYCICNLLKRNSTGLFESVSGIASFVFMIIYIIKFCNACEELLKDRDRDLVGSWDIYKTVVLFTYALAIIFGLLLYIPVLNVIAVIVIATVSIAQLVFIIWHIILLKRTDEALRMPSHAA